MVAKRGEKIPGFVPKVLGKVKVREEKSDLNENNTSTKEIIKKTSEKKKIEKKE
jgi:hypothetical protein